MICDQLQWHATSTARCKSLTPCMWLFYFFAAIVIWLGILSLRGGFRFAAYVKLATRTTAHRFHPFRYSDRSLPRIRAWSCREPGRAFQQTYPSYEIVFVTDSENDPSLEVIRDSHHEAIRTSCRSRLDRRRSNRLRTEGAQPARRSCADRSAQRGAGFCRFGRPAAGELVAVTGAPLADDELGAATGYRWFIPVNGGLASHLRSVWNASIASALGANGRAISAGVVQQRFGVRLLSDLNISERWRGSVSDDFTLTRVSARRSCRFISCRLVWWRHWAIATLAELLEFSNRQLKITRVYAPHLWKPVLLGSLCFVSCSLAASCW